MRRSTPGWGKPSTWGRALGKQALSKGNVMKLTESSKVTETKLKRIAALSAANSDMVFTHVIHHINKESLQTCFHELDGRC